MDLAELETFLALARAHSFTGAARELHLTQPGVSRQVQRLERELDVQLVRRGSRASLTPAGERFLSFARRTLSAYQRMREEIGVSGVGEARPLAGSLRIAASTTPGEFVVPALLNEFTALHRDVHPQVFIGDSAAVLDELRELRSDIGFVGTRAPGRRFRYEPVTEDEIVLAVPREHRFAERGSVPLAELAGEPFIEREEGSGTLATVRAVAAAQGLELPPYHIVMVLGTSEAIVTAVERGFGVGWVSEQPLSHRDARRIATVRIDELALSRPLYVVWDERRTLPLTASRFVSWVMSEEGQLVRSAPDPFVER